jgi:hypothetical protein
MSQFGITRVSHNLTMQVNLEFSIVERKRPANRLG